MKQTQQQWVIEQLRRDGQITRNQCLSRFPAITRLGAIVCDLRANGWQLEASNRDGDYVYKLVDRPRERKVEYVLEFREGTPVRVPRVVLI